MLAKPQGFPRKLGGCAGLDPRFAALRGVGWCGRWGTGASGGGSGHRV